MSNTNHITYLFGAGASYNSMPVVAELNNDLKKWASIASDRFMHDEAHKNRFLDETPELRLNFIKNYVTSVVEAIDGFETVDTLARFYTLRKMKNELYILKKVIDAYFFFRQFGGDEGSLMSDNSLRRAPKQIFDRRYDSFFAKILQADCQLPDNVSMLSWNYDLEVERSIAKYKDNDAYDNFEHVYHINGRSTPVVRPRTSNNANAYRTLSFAGGDKIQYAWERPEKVKDEVASRLVNTTHIVIIGYSFPDFNKEIDQQILAAPNLQKVYIQDLPSVIPKIEDLVKERLLGRADYTPALYKTISTKDGDEKVKMKVQQGIQIDSTKSPEQFHIPFELI